MFAQMLYPLARHEARFLNCLAARSECQKQAVLHKPPKNNYTKSLQLALKLRELDNELARMPTISLDNVHEKRFPRANASLFGASATGSAEWHWYFTNRKLYDGRPNVARDYREFMFDNDPNNWKLVVKPDEDIIVPDSKTGEIVLMSTPDELGKRGYVQLWFMSRKIPTAADGGAALALALEDRVSHPGSWGGCRAKCVSTSDITRALKSWDEPTFRQQARRMLRRSQVAEAPPHHLEQAGSERNGEDNGEHAGVEADDAELVQPDHLDQHDYDPGADDNELDMDWQPTDRDSDSPDSSSSSGEDRPQRPVVRRQHRAQGLRVTPPFRQRASLSPSQGPQAPMAAADLIQAPRQLIQVRIPPRAPQLIQTPPKEEVLVALGEDIDNQLQQQIIQEQAASIVGEHDYRLLMEMVPTMREVLAAHVSPEHNVCADPAVFGSAHGIDWKGVRIKKSVRLDDPYIFSVVAYKPGSGNCPSMKWAQNLLGKKTVTDTQGASPAALTEYVTS
jgi:hypothetical protein